MFYTSFCLGLRNEVRENFVALLKTVALLLHHSTDSEKVTCDKTVNIIPAKVPQSDQLQGTAKLNHEKSFDNIWLDALRWCL